MARVKRYTGMADIRKQSTNSVPANRSYWCAAEMHIAAVLTPFAMIFGKASSVGDHDDNYAMRGRHNDDL